MNLRDRAAAEDGSILPLILGYALLALTLVFVCVDATSLYLARTGADGVADAAALAAADGAVLNGLSAQPGLREDDARRAAGAIVEAVPEVTLVSSRVSRGGSVRVTVETVWHPPILSIIVPDGVTVRATATARAALR